MSRRSLILWSSLLLALILSIGVVTVTFTVRLFSQEPMAIYEELFGQIYEPGVPRRPVGGVTVKVIALSDHYDATGLILKKPGDTILSMVSRSEFCPGTINFGWNHAYTPPDGECLNEGGLPYLYYGSFKVVIVDDGIEFESPSKSTPYEKYEWLPAGSNAAPEKTPLSDIVIEFDAVNNRFTDEKFTQEPNPSGNNFVFHAPSDYSNIASVTYGYRWFGTVYVDDDFTIPSGKRVTVNPGTTILVAVGKRIIVDGTFEILGTPSEPVLVDRQGSTGTWAGIVFNSGSTGNMDYATIRHATKGIFVDSTSPTVKNSTIEDFTEQGVYGVDSDLVVQDSFIGKAASASHGIYLLGSGSPTVSGNTIEDVPIGIERKGSPGQATLSGNTIERCTDGIKTWQSSPEIFNNDVEKNLWGVRLWTDSAPDLHDNDIYTNSVGVYLEQSQPSNVKWNNFGASGGTLLENADEGMLVNDLESGNTFLDGKWNNFYDGYATKDIANATAATLKATGNYWYDQSTSGPVDASSPQTRANPDAGPGGAQGKLAEAGWQASPQKVDVVSTTFRLEPNFPNPFNPRAVIRFALPEEAVVSVTILDIGGRVVRRLVLNTSYAAGIHQVMWDGRDDSGEVVASGLYFYRIEAATRSSKRRFSDSRKLVFIR